MKIQKVALIGAGAIGAYLIWSFGGVSDATFTVVAEEVRKERLEQDGVVMNGVYHPLRAREITSSGRRPREKTQHAQFNNSESVTGQLVQIDRGISLLLRQNLSSSA